MTTYKLRVARPSDDLDALIPFYRDGLGLSILSRFEDHEGFDGVILGSPNAPYHFEFTRSHRHKAGRAPSHDHLLVFYVPDFAYWRAAMDRMKQVGFLPVPSLNPYWDQRGCTFEDPDGYRIVIQQAEWSL